ncbi:MAG TPA: J domain-containing protein [Desulfomonilia bacterium]|nr:J domain-containing protein [Desulfomonilia bacterium]
MKKTFTIEEYPFPLVMMDAIKSRFTGIIFVSSEHIKKGLIFNEGTLCAIQSNKTEELLGNILVGMGLISEDEKSWSLNTSRLECKKLGIFLLEMFLVQPMKINEALRLQTEKRFMDIFSWESGTIQKVTKDNINKEPDISMIEMKHLIRKAIMEYTPFSCVIKSLSPFADSRAIIMANTLTGENSIKIADISQHTVADILLLGPESSRELFSLYCTGEISFEENKHKPLIDTLRAKLKTLKDQDPFEVFGVDNLISDGGLKRAYIKVVKTNHPDAYAYADNPQVKQLANEIFSEIQRAYSIISKLREGKAVEEPQCLQAEILYRKATELLKAKDYENAIDNFKLCVMMRPDERLFVESYVKTLFLRLQKTGFGSPLIIKSIIQESLNRFSNSDTLWLIYGWVLKKEGSKKAIEAFQKAYEINKNNIYAQRQMQLYQRSEEQ